MTWFEQMKHPTSADIVFAVIDEGGWGACPQGVILYSDGVLCEYNRDAFFENEPAKETFTLLGSNPKMAEEILDLIRENDKRISRLPVDMRGCATDQRFTEINFHGKCCEAYAIFDCPDAEETIFWHNEILRCIRRYGYLKDRPFLQWDARTGDYPRYPG